MHVQAVNGRLYCICQSERKKKRVKDTMALVCVYRNRKPSLTQKQSKLLQNRKYTHREGCWGICSSPCSHPCLPLHTSPVHCPLAKTAKQHYRLYSNTINSGLLHEGTSSAKLAKNFNFLFLLQLPKKPIYSVVFEL